MRKERVDTCALGLGLVEAYFKFCQQEKKERSPSLETRESGYKVPLRLGYVDLSGKKPNKKEKF